VDSWNNDTKALSTKDSRSKASKTDEKNNCLSFEALNL
jgi:hypothetical protein